MNRGRPKTPKHLHRSKYIKVYLTEEEFDSLQGLKKKLYERNPNQNIQDIFRLFIKQIDDPALLFFLYLPRDDQMRKILTLGNVPN